MRILLPLALACRPDETTPQTTPVPTGDTGARTDPDAPHLSDLQASLFTPTCATALCHSAAQASGGLVLEDGAAWDNLVNVAASGLTTATRVVPGAAVNSYLVLKLEAGDGIAGVPMPFGGQLDPTSITPVRWWIDAGALDN